MKNKSTFLKRRDSESDLLAKALDARDRDNPDWDKEARIAVCVDDLKGGVGTDRLYLRYGEGIVVEAKKRLQQDWKQVRTAREIGESLEERAYALIMENGGKNYSRFPVLGAAWPALAPALPLFVSGPEPRLQAVCDAFSRFLDFTGRWDVWSELSREAELRAIDAKNFLKAGWRAYDAGWLHFVRGQSPEIFVCAERAAKHWREVNAGPREQAYALQLLGLGHQIAKDYSAAIRIFREAVKLHRFVRNESNDVAIALNDIADAEKLNDDIDAARRNYREALRIALSVDDNECAAKVRGKLADLALAREDWPGAESLAREALPSTEKVGRQELVARDCRRLAAALVRQGKSVEALTYARRSVEIYANLGSPDLVVAEATLRECEGRSPLGRSRELLLTRT